MTKRILKSGALDPVKVIKALEPLSQVSLSFSEGQIEQFVRITQDTTFLHTREAVNHGYSGIIVPANQISIAYEALLRNCLFLLEMKGLDFWLNHFSFRMNDIAYARENLEPSASEVTIQTGGIVRLTNSYAFRENGTKKIIEFRAGLKLREEETNPLSPLKEHFLSRRYALSREDIEDLGNSVGMKLDYVPSMLFPSFVTSAILQHASKRKITNLGYNARMSVDFSQEVPHTGRFYIKSSKPSHGRAGNKYVYSFSAQCAQQRNLLGRIKSFIVTDDEVDERAFMKSQSRPLICIF